MKDWDFGYFGKGVDGYAHYKQAFDRNFSQKDSTSKPTARPAAPDEGKPEQKPKGNSWVGILGLWAVAFLLFCLLLAFPQN